MRIVKIEVTQADIDEGIRLDCETCPVARAMIRALNLPVLVGSSRWSIKGDAKGFTLPGAAIGFVMRFDNLPKKLCKPFAFEIEAADDIVKPVLPSEK